MSLDWNDLNTVRRFLVGLRVHVDDADSVVKDMLKPRRKRRLGHKEHCRLYREGWEAAIEAIDSAMPPPPNPTPMQ